MVWQAFSQSWPAFALVVGLLLVGEAAGADGLFEAIGSRLAHAPLPPTGLLLAALGLVAVVTALLNLDTAVVFLTPTLVHVARGRGLDERPFLYGTVLMANAASLLLPGSNLTNLIVLAGRESGGVALAEHTGLAWLAAVAVTAIGVAVALRPGVGRRAPAATVRLRLGIGAAAVLGSMTLLLSLQAAALPVLAVGLATTALRRSRPRLDLRVLALLLVLAVGLGAGARMWPAPSAVLDSSGVAATAAIGALAAVVLDNLPAAALLSAHHPAHPLALLVGLDLGPNLAVTGSLSAYLWWHAARRAGARPSIGLYSRLGLALAPLAGCAALLGLSA